MARRGFGLTGAGHIAQVSGFYRTGHLLRAGNQLGIGANAEGASGSIAELGVAAAGVAVALGAVVVAAKLIEVGFGAISKSATELVGAIAQIGGARGLQGMLVEAAESEAMASRIAANLATGVTTKMVLDVVQGISKNTEWNPGQAGDIFRGFASKRGGMIGFEEFKEMGPFIADLASVMKDFMKPGDVGQLIGQIRVATADLSTQETMQITKNLWGLGRAGVLELSQSGSVMQALQFARNIDPSLTKGMNLEFGMMQLAQGSIGGETGAKAATYVRRLQEQLLEPVNLKRNAAIQRFLGPDAFRVNDMGEKVFTDFPKALAQLAVAELSGKLPQGILEGRSRIGLRDIGVGLEREGVIKEGMTKGQREEAAEIYFRKIENTTMSLEEFKKATDEVKEALSYQLSKAFNEMSIELEIALLPVLKEMVPVVDAFSKTITAKKDDIALFFGHLVNWVALLADNLPRVLDAFMELLEWTLKLTIGITWVFDVMTHPEKWAAAAMGTLAPPDFSHNEALQGVIKSHKNLQYQEALDAYDDAKRKKNLAESAGQYEESGYDPTAAASIQADKDKAAADARHKEIVHVNQQANNLLDLVHKGITYNPLIPPSRAEIGL